ncbi:hypothetical protein J3R80_08585 [Aliiroseovarius sp. Z3]|uniref:hypothetical protein n=1 Tax=Aliiroseovarius sp. Z3 TaxID=2811402 RepID=UPI0023B23D5F|nr:hypothetical protein [Aliiroseovarius sp. Z3]MDE9450520.1 hypothetical protein [Aliiroseovarius sp. Z3]
MMRDLVKGTEDGFGILDPIGTNLTPKPKLYLQLLRQQADALSDCLNGTDS